MELKFDKKINSKPNDESSDELDHTDTKIMKPCKPDSPEYCNPQNKSPEVINTISFGNYFLYEESESDHRWDDFEREENEMRQCVAEKEKQSSDKHGEFIDSEPCIPPGSDTIELPDYVTGIDRVYLKSKVIELQQNEKRAKETARFYRDRCCELKAKILETQQEQVKLKVQSIHEKNQIRYFWRNKILEGQSRSGKMVRTALNINNHKII